LPHEREKAFRRNTDHPPGRNPGLFLDLGQDVAGPGQPFNESAQELAIETQLAGI
jgi:hypothetical protein